MKSIAKIAVGVFLGLVLTAVVAVGVVYGGMIVHTQQDAVEPVVYTIF